MVERLKHILVELKGHAPFTLVGALLGIVFMLIFRNVSTSAKHTLFSVFHPGHVILSAIVTASMFRLHADRKNFLLIVVIGYFGSIGIATLSDIIIPHVGSEILGLDVPSHSAIHEHDGAEPEGDSDGHKIHFGFIEEWYIVNPAAILGILIAYFFPRTKFPHAGHILISTWASSSYLLMNTESNLSIAAATAIFATLFMAVWVPCCISDIVFPLLFAKSDLEIEAPCPIHGKHSHPHVPKYSQDDENQGRSED